MHRFGGTLSQQVQELDWRQLCVIVSQVLGDDWSELQDVRGEENRLFGQWLNIRLHGFYYRLLQLDLVD